VGNAKVDFPSHFGIAYFAKVSPGDDIVRPYVFNVRGVLLDDLHICDGCDAEGVPDLMRSSGKHTEEHHLIRCLAPEKVDDKDKATPTEQRLASMEGRLDGRLDSMQRQLDDFTGHLGDLNARIGNIEQLLHRLLGATEGLPAAHFSHPS
jgi:hypothetical protein